MSESIDKSASDAGPAPHVPASFLAALCQRVGVPHREPAEAPTSGPAPSRGWQEAFAAAARNTGLEIHRVALDPSTAIDSVRPEAPLVRWQPERGWLVLSADRRGRAVLQAHDGRARRVDVEGLRERLGAAPGAALPWLSIRAGLPVTPQDATGPNSPFMRLVDLVRPDREDVIAIVLYAVFIGLLSLAIPIAVQQLVNSVAFGGLVQPVVVLALLLFIGLLFSAALSTMQAWLAEILQRRIFVRVSLQLAERLPRVRSDAFGVRHGPEQANRFFDLVNLQKTGARLLLEGSGVLLQTLAGLVILSFYHPLMLGLSVVLIASMGFVVFVLGRGGPSTALGESSAKYAIAEWIEELARHPTLFRSASGRLQAAARADALATRWIEARRAHYRIVLRQFIGSHGLQAVVNTLVLALGGFLVVSGELTLGQLVASEIIVAAVVAAFARLGKQLEYFYDLLAATGKLGTLFDLPVERESGRRRTAPRGPAALEAIELGLSDRRAPRGVSLRLAPGERLAVRGASGSGKSSLAALLGAQEEADEGRLELDGIDYRELELETLRAEVAAVCDAEIFAGTIEDNLALARADLCAEEIPEMLDRLGLLEELRALPAGLATRLGTNGAPLSRSQIARLGFARALLARPRLLIVDGELPLLAGDARERVLDALFDPARPFTLVVVSQAADVEARADRTIVLPDPRRPRLVRESPATAAEDAS